MQGVCCDSRLACAPSPRPAQLTSLGLQHPCPRTQRPLQHRPCRQQPCESQFQWLRGSQRLSSHVCAARGASGEPWWTKNNPDNMHDVHSVQELVDQMATAGDRLVILDFYAQWCHACRSLFPKLCKLCEENSDIVLLKVDWDNNKAIAKALNIKVLPYFHFYRGSDGLLAAFSASISKVQRLRDAVAQHNTARCYVGEREKGMAEFPGVEPHVQEAAAVRTYDHPEDATHLTSEHHEGQSSAQTEHREPAAV